MLTESYMTIARPPDAVPESIERKLPAWTVGSLNHSHVKAMVYEIVTCHYRAWRLALIGYDDDWLVQYQDNVTVWDSRS